MTIRQTVVNLPNESQLETPNTTPSNFYIPPCGIEDVDKALFNLFDKELSFSVQKYIHGANGIVNVKKPIVMMASGERFAVVKKLKPVRDKNGALLLPAISIRRTGVPQTYQDMNSRGINQSSGELVIKTRLDSSDRDYQNLINKLGMQNAALISSSRETSNNSEEASIKAGMFLDPKLGANIWEIVTMPSPQFYTATYEIVFWTSFTEHMNYMIEVLMSSQLPQGKTFKLTTDKGYWFIANVEEEMSSQDNSDDYTDQERMFKYSFSMKVPAYIIAFNGPGAITPFKKYLSAVNIAFSLHEGSIIEKSTIEKVNNIPASGNKFALTDLMVNEETAQAPTTLNKFLLKKSSIDPRTGKKITKYVKIPERGNKSGETVYQASDFSTLEEFLDETSTPINKIITKLR